MPPPSKVTLLPPCIRQEIERRLIDNGFRDYAGLAQWVHGEGYEISDDSLWRYGRKLQQEFTAVRLSMLSRIDSQARPPVQQSLLMVAQQKALATLFGTEQVTPAMLNQIARLLRAIVSPGEKSESKGARQNPPSSASPPSQEARVLPSHAAPPPSGAMTGSVASAPNRTQPQLTAEKKFAGPPQLMRQPMSVCVHVVRRISHPPPAAEKNPELSAGSPLMRLWRRTRGMIGSVAEGFKMTGGEACSPFP